MVKVSHPLISVQVLHKTKKRKRETLFLRSLWSAYGSRMLPFIFDMGKSHQSFPIQHEICSTNDLQSKRVTWISHPDEKQNLYWGEWRGAAAAIKPNMKIIPRSPTWSLAEDAFGQTGFSQRRCTPCDLCAWLHFAPVPAFLRNIPKDLDCTFPTRYPLSWPPSPRTRPSLSTLHYIFAYHLKESRTGRAGGMSSGLCAAPIQKTWRHLASTKAS